MQNPAKKSKLSASFAAAWIPVGGWLAFIFSASSMQIAPGMLPPIPYLDKIFHSSEYWVYGVLLERAVALRNWSGWKKWGVLVLIIAGTGFLDEFYQRFIPTRHSDPADWMMDVIAGSIGVLMYAWDLRSRKI